jgi:hypothetical protein
MGLEQIMSTEPVEHQITTMVSILKQPIAWHERRENFSTHPGIQDESGCGSMT